ncbi:heterokaryon incompatibility protein-domain-containing protein [Apodospora peruviana]|uniref:Heterokaryon incompatibility protein-domain-containing protein n=1 Tax=Apodospora peruviana TaxID=516989 RepID=A0AAE0MB41_9PEZI|nr:heterokaryon incompatibility protein-domain-containing protein [Apodospora peruviana]
MASSSSFSSLSSSPHTCSHCQQVQVAFSEDVFLRYLPTNWGDRQPLPFNGPVDGSKVVAGALAGCEFFEWTLHEIRKFYTEQELSTDWTLTPYVYVGMLTRYPDIPFLGFWWMNKSTQMNLSTFALQTVVEDSSDNIAASYVWQRPSMKSVSSPDAFERIKTWLNTCHESHEQCSRYKSPFMPSNVISITNPNTGNKSDPPAVRLIHNPPSAPYAALSYCWGGDQPVKATKATVDDLTQGIDYRQLPKAIQDAITTTQAIGLQYLWVDALCIVQDDPVLMASEIAQMCQIYQTAHVTISAARSSACTQGFLDDITIPDKNSPAFRLTLLNPNDPSAAPGFIICFPKQLQDPVEYRAWTLQERLMSPRVLKFSQDETVMMCLESAVSGDDGLPYYMYRPGKREMSDYWHASHDQDIKLMNHFHERLLSQEHTDALWVQLVTEFCGRLITNRDDQILAISGIASHFGRLWRTGGGKYMAGLWEEQFPGALMWYTDGLHEEIKGSRDYLGPTWSWISVGQGISYYGVDRWTGASTHRTCDPDFQLLDANIELENEASQFGALMEGCSITVRGWMRKVEWVPATSFMTPCPPPPPMTGSRADRDSTGEEEEEMLAETWPDRLEYVANRQRFVVWCLQVANFDPDTQDGPYGLILMETTSHTVTRGHDKVVFKRMGLFAYSRRSLKGRYPDTSIEDYEEQQRTWIGKAELRDITIE